MKSKSLPKYVVIFFFICGMMSLISCNAGDRKHILLSNNTDMVFPKGEKVKNDNFEGTVWLNYLAENDTMFNVNIGSVTFEPNARTNWHFHKGGQILLVTHGRGLYQEKGKSVVVIKKGDVIKCAPDTEHWHGATPTEAMIHVAIGTNTNTGGAVWLKPVTDEEYKRNAYKQFGD
jgi:quercetin dioxygenase-like cupin family protein